MSAPIHEPPTIEHLIVLAERIKNGAMIKEIAHEEGITTAMLYRWMDRHKIEIRSTTRKPYITRQEIDDRIADWYGEHQRSIKQWDLEAGKPITSFQMRQHFGNIRDLNQFMRQLCPYQEPAKPKTVERKCLRCDTRFQSKGAHNRLCAKCGCDPVDEDVLGYPLNGYYRGGMLDDWIHDDDLDGIEEN